MSTEPPQEPPTQVAPSPYQGSPAAYEPAGPPPEDRGHAGPWILAAAIVLVIGALAAVLIHNADTSDTQTVINRTPTVNTTSVERSGTVTQNTTTVTAPAKTTTTVTV